MGNFFKYYYSYLMQGKIPIGIKKDNLLDNKDEYDYNIDEEFLGFSGSYQAILYISEALCLLNWNKFDEYPIIKNKEKFSINEDALKDIINNNEDVFYFIGNELNQISFNDYLTFLINIESNKTKSKIFLDKDFIYLKEINLFG